MRGLKLGARANQVERCDGARLVLFSDHVEVVLIRLDRSVQQVDICVARAQFDDGRRQRHLLGERHIGERRFARLRGCGVFFDRAPPLAPEVRGPTDIAFERIRVDDSRRVAARATVLGGRTGCADRRIQAGSRDLHFNEGLLIVRVVLAHSLVGHRHERFELVDQRVVKAGPPFVLRSGRCRLGLRPTRKLRVGRGHVDLRPVVVRTDRTAVDQHGQGRDDYGSEVSAGRTGNPHLDAFYPVVRVSETDPRQECGPPDQLENVSGRSRDRSLVFSASL